MFFETKPPLKVQVNTNRAQYRPGDLAHVDVVLTDSDGKPVTGAVGFAAIDKAVEQRAKSVQEGRFSPTGWWRYDAPAIDWSANDPGAELLAAATAAEYQSDYPVVFPSLFVFRSAELYRERVNRDVVSLRAALNRLGKPGRPFPPQPNVLQTALSAYGVKSGALRDPWGTTYKLRIASEHEWMRIAACSGPRSQVRHCGRYLSSPAQMALV